MRRRAYSAFRRARWKSTAATAAVQPSASSAAASSTPSTIWKPGLTGPPAAQRRTLATSRPAPPATRTAKATFSYVAAPPHHSQRAEQARCQIVEAEDLGFKTSQFLRFTPYQLLTAIGRQTGARDYKLLKGAFARLQSTVIRTTIRHGEHWRRQQFSWINEWEELTTHAGRCEGMEFVLPEWFYQGVLDRRLVLAIDPAYFALSGGIERWLYRVARKHAGHQRDGWRFELRHLHAKSASLARFSDFALDIRWIVARQPLPGYQLALGRRDGRELILMRPNLSTGPVEIRPHLSGLWAQPLSGFRAHPYRDFGRTRRRQVLRLRALR